MPGSKDLGTLSQQQPTSEEYMAFFDVKKIAREVKKRTNN